MFDLSSYKISSKSDISIDISIYSKDDVFDKLLLITHGYGEHKDYYQEFAKYFVNRGFVVCTYDLRSHGKSGGKRGHVPLFDLFLDDIDAIIDFLKNKIGQFDLYMFGHSMGGSIVLNYIYRRSRYKIEKAIISSPWLKLAFEPPKSKLFLAKIGKVLFPSVVLKGELDTKNLSRDPGFTKRFEEDFNTYDKISPAYFFEIRNAGLYMLDEAPKMTIPILLTHGSDDNITSIDASKEFCKKHSGNSEFKEWTGYKHVVFSEEDKEKIFDYYYKFLAK